jgi:4-amino-4-deoxy-L-arabinose transferase-like glycosyltransferase
VYSKTPLAQFVKFNNLRGLLLILSRKTTHMKTGSSLIAWAIAAGASLAWCAEVPAQRSYVYVGGQYTQDSAGQHVFTNQMYVEKLMPTTGVTKPYPIVFIHGQAQTGTVCI